jgi:hypothetical protein
MSTPKRKFPLYRTLALGLLSIAIIGGIIFTAISNNNREKSDASASVPQTDCQALQMQPDESCTFTITYSNGEGEATTNSILEVYIGSLLIPDQTSFKNTITKINGTDVANQVETTINYASVDVSSSYDPLDNGPWTQVLNYKPGSDPVFTDNDTAAKDGNLPASVEGKITFSVKLSPNVFTTNIGNTTTKYTPYSGTGDISNTSRLRTQNNQGVYAVLGADQLSDSEKVPGSLSIILLAADAAPTYTNSGTLTGTIGSSVGGTITFTGTPTLTGSATFTNGGSCSITGTVANNVFTPTGNIPAGCPTGSRTNGTITVGSTTITGVGSNFVANTPTYTNSGTLTGTIGSSVGGTITFTGTPTLTGSATFTNGGSCSITGTVANNVFTPTGNIPAGCPTGSRTNGTITVGSTTITGVGSNFSEAPTSGNCDDKFGNNCRLYFVGANNTPVAWNSAFQTNTGWNKEQKYKDGVAKLVFDNIKNNSGAAIANGSSCKFALARYGATDQLKEYTATTTAGKAEVTFPVVDQTVNYYTVVVTCTESGTNEIVKDYDRLVLIVGASGDRDGGNVDL